MSLGLHQKAQGEGGGIFAPEVLFFWGGEFGQGRME